jgi:UDP-glucose 4-epimerase
MKCLVVGHRGLIGSAVSRELSQTEDVYTQESVVRWADISAAKSDLQAIAGSFRAFVGSEQWVIFWCAGKGFLGSLPGELDSEVEVFRSFLSDIAAWGNTDGVVVFASSAGAIWNPTNSVSIEEDTPDNGTTPYAQAKLHQETILRQFCRESSVGGIIARISSVYGDGQDLQKQQGLISRMCLASVTRTPVSIFVPLETTRNYIFARDLAKMMIKAARAEIQSASKVRDVKKFIMCSRDNHSIASVCRAVESVSRQKLLKSTHLSGDLMRYPLHFQLRPRNSKELLECESTTLIAGVSVVYKEILRRYQLGLIPDRN